MQSLNLKEIVETLQCKRKMPFVEPIVIEILDDDVNVHIVHPNPTTKRKEAQCKKVAPKATKSKKKKKKKEW